jgi:hypothetical protein
MAMQADRCDKMPMDPSPHSCLISTAMHEGNDCTLNSVESGMPPLTNTCQVDGCVHERRAQGEPTLRQRGLGTTVSAAYDARLDFGDPS